MTKNCKSLQLKKIISNTNLHLSNPKPPWRLLKLQEKLSILKENFQHLKKKFLSVFPIFIGLFCPPVSEYGSSRPQWKRNGKIVKLFKLQEKLSVLKEHIQHLQQISSLFLIFMGLFALLYPVTDLADHNESAMQIRILNTVTNH